MKRRLLAVLPMAFWPAAVFADSTQWHLVAAVSGTMLVSYPAQ